MKIRKIGIKITAISLIALALGLVVSSGVLIQGLNSVLDNSLIEQSTKSLNAMESHIEQVKEVTTADTLILSENRVLINAVKANDYERIKLTIEDVYQANRFDTNLITVSDANGTVLCRYYSDEKGDSIQEFDGFAEALNGNVTTVLSSGKGIKLGIVTNAPIIDASGKIVGVTSVTYPLDDADVVDGLKELTSNEYTIFLGNERINTTIINDGNRAIGTTLDPKIAKIVLENKKEYHGNAEILGKAYATAYKPILNDDGEAIGVLFSGMEIENILNKQMQTYIICAVSIITVSVLLALIMSYLVNKMAAKPIKLMARAGTELSSGKLDINLEFESNDELGILAEELRTTISTLRRYVKDISNNLERMATGDMTIEIHQDYIGDFLPIKNSMIKISQSLNETLYTINQAADQVTSGSEQVSDGAQALSQGATEQASAIEELSASIAEITVKIEQNAEDAKSASDKTVQAGAELTICNEQMEAMVNAMEQINEKSAEISKIIKVIDDIAFQTNILALNAAVEAARAGTLGKGFAVVAEEVRTLAGRSADAANSTTTLIEETLAAVKNGTLLVGKTSDAVKNSVSIANDSHNLINQIAKSSNEQSLAISEVNNGVEQISAVVQTNAATAEESAAASEELSSQSNMLKELISSFKLKKIDY